jgi:hypothetical protein
MKLDDQKTIETFLAKMDKDCSIRVAISAVGGRKKFAEQMEVECNVMASRMRNAERAASAEDLVER